MPPWGDVGAAEFAKFTDLTGIKVALTTLPFEQVHDKIVAAMVAGTPPADVMEVDSVWVGQFAAANWLTPISDYVAPGTLATVQGKPLFTVNNQLQAMPWVVDFRWTVANMSLLAKAGITTQPQSWADIETDAKALKDQGVLKYPVASALSITASSTITWLTAEVSAGGTILDASGKPTFAAPGSAGYQAMDFMRRLYSDGLIDPASVSLTGAQASSEFAGGQAAFDLRNGPGFLAQDLDPTSSKVANDKLYPFLAGPTGVAQGVFSLPEALGIPANSTNKCAASMFLAWWNETPEEVFRYTMPAGSSFPAQQPAIDQVLSTGNPDAVKAIRATLPLMQPLFLGGSPVWYPQWQLDVASAMQSIITGQTPIADGLNTLATQTEALQTK